MEQSSTVAKRLWHIMRLVYYMIRKGFTKHKLALELNLLHKRGKIAGKALRNFLAFHHHHHSGGGGGSGGAHSSSSCRYLDPNLSVYNPQGVEFSCGNTPSYPARRHSGRRQDVGDELDASMIAKAFEILNSEELSDAESSSMGPSPSPAPFWNFGKSPAVAVRQLRITDSPFPLREDEQEEADGKVDVMAEEFIRRFYEGLQLQQRIPETPDNQHLRRKHKAGRA